MSNVKALRKRRVLLFTTTSEIGGTERSFLSLAAQFNQDGWDVWVASLEFGGPFLKLARTAGLRTFSPEFHTFLNPQYLFRIYKFLRDNKMDVVCVSGLRGKLCLLPLAAMMRVPVRVSSLRGLDVWKRRWHIWIEKCLHPLTTFWIANSQAAKDKAVTSEGKPVDRVYVIYQGLEVQPQSANLDQSTTKSSTGLFKIGVVANIRSGKGHAFFLEVIKGLIEEDKDIVAYFIGKDYSEGRISRMIKKCGLDNHVVLTGFVENINEYLRSLRVDLMVLPSFTESFPTSLIEGMLEGIPLVATHVGGIPELLRHKKTGWLTEPGSHAEMQDAIRTLMENSELRSQMARAAQAEARKRFDIKKVAPEYERLFEMYLRGVQMRPRMGHRFRCLQKGVFR